MYWEVLGAWTRVCAAPALLKGARHRCGRTPHQCHLPRDRSFAKASREKGTLLSSLLHRLGEPGYSSSWKLSSLVS